MTGCSTHGRHCTSALPFAHAWRRVHRQGGHDERRFDRVADRIDLGLLLIGDDVSRNAKVAAHESKRDQVPTRS